MDKISLLGKTNSDGSYSMAVRADILVEHCFVNFYNESTGEGYQRSETQRATRGRDIERYIARCAESNTKPALFEMIANALSEKANWEFEPLDEEDELGWLHFNTITGPSLSMIDGGTRLLGIENALRKGIIPASMKFDVRVYLGVSLATEVAYFLLINETQKKVRTDLSLRVVQRLLDEGNLTDEEMDVLKSADNGAEGWRYDAIRITGTLNSDSGSKWFRRVQMPGETARCATLQAYFSSLKNLLNNKTIENALSVAEDRGELKTADGQTTDIHSFLTRVLRDFWEAVALINSDANLEPETNVLWAPIGANTHHIALTSVLATMLSMNDYDFSVSRFASMMSESYTEDYDYWYTKPGTKLDSYPKSKGEATKMTGAANYKRLADALEDQWRSKLHAELGKGVISA